MKKVIIAGLVVSDMAMSAVADATYNVNVFTAGGYETSVGVGDGANPLLPNVGDSALVQLYYVGGNGIIDTTVGVGGTSGDDVIIGSFLQTNNGGANEQYALVNGIVADPNYLGANVFARIFDTADAGAGSWYYTGSVQPVAAYDTTVSPPPLPEGYDITGVGIQPLNTGQVIPEPATIGLMGIAGLGMFLARRKTRR